MAVLREARGARVFSLHKKVTVLGRDPTCDVVIGGIHASGRHAMIINAGESYHIADLDSLNGTYINRKRITRRTRLCSGDEIGIGGLQATFEVGEPAPATPKMAHLPPTQTLSREELTTIQTSLDLSGDLRPHVAAEAKLRAVLEISKNLSKSLNLDEVLPQILETLFALFPQADRGYILLSDPGSQQLVPKAVHHRREEGTEPLSISQGIIRHAIQCGKAILSADAAQDRRFDPHKSVRQLQIRSIMCVPMISQMGEVLGVIQLDTRDKLAQFRREDLDVLVSASTQAARAIELARLHMERRDLEAATQIQRSFLPSEQPRIPGMKFFDHYSPARRIGGDYYDYIPLPGQRLAVALGDVAGKGIAAALLMARLSAAVRFCLASESGVANAVRQLNRVLVRQDTADRFVTFILAVVDLESFQMIIVNAGHMPPLRRSPGKQVEELCAQAAGLPLGVLDKPYEEMVTSMEPGDTIVLYTDGVTEAHNALGELYGCDRLKAAIRNAPSEVESLGKAILTDVRQFAADLPQHDDLTIACFGRC